MKLLIALRARLRARLRAKPHNDSNKRPKLLKIEGGRASTQLSNLLQRKMLLLSLEVMRSLQVVHQAHQLSQLRCGRKINLPAKYK